MTRTFALLVLLVPTLLGAAPAAKEKKADLAVELTFLDHASRQKVAEQRLVLALDAKNAEHALRGEGLSGWKARTLAREVTVNDAAKGYFVEVTLFRADGAEAGYLAAILPRDPGAAFSAATKVTAGEEPLDAVLTRAP